VLALSDERPLREVPLRPDPHSAFAHAFEALRDELGDTASVIVDLMPVTPAARRQWARKVIAAERRSGPNGRGGAASDFMAGMGHGGANGRGGGAASDFMAGMGHGSGHRSSAGRATTSFRPEAGSVEAAERRESRRAISHKLVGHQTAFTFQVLVRASSEIEGRPQRIVADLIDAFSVWGGENYLRVSGIRLGPWFAGADAPWRRIEFDRRFNTGRFGPRHRRLVSAREILGLLKPPTVHCSPLNVMRSGGLVPAPPRGLPGFGFQPGVLPLGTVRTADGERPVGVYLKDTFFAYMSGRSRYGKSETGINQFIHLARSGEGCFFLDPHADAIGRIKPYLTEVADRIVEINLASRGDHRQAAWNLFSMEGLGAEDLEAKQSAIVSSFSSAMQWNTGSNTRALNLTTMASKTLLELALVLPPEIAPTIFQMATLLSNDDWRAAVLPHVSAHCRDFWLHRFPKQTGGGEAITPVTNIIDMLRSSPSVAALLGASRSTLDIRRCMDQGAIVLACPAGADDKDRLVANFLVYEVLRAALSRKDTPPNDRRPFYVWFDEVQTYDGASTGNLARLLEQVGKYGIKAFLLNQNPRRLTEATKEAVFMNSSHVATATLDAAAAATLADQWGKAVSATTIERLERFTYLTSVTLGTQVTRPFLVRGFEVSKLWAEHYNPEGVVDMERVIDEAQGRRPVAETLAALDGLDDAIAEHLAANHDSARLQLVPAGADAEAGARPKRRADHVRWDQEL